MTAYNLAQRFVGIKEVPGSDSNPQILAMLRLDGDWPKDDAVPWCSAFVNYICWLLRLPRSKSLRARSWLQVGRSTQSPVMGNAVVILNRGGVPNADIIDAPGHVGFFAGFEGDKVLILGGNQGDGVTVARFPKADVLGYRELT